jgi:hypothetical protein
MTILAVLVGCGLAVLAATWIGTGRIEYWTGRTEQHHFVATPDSAPISYWLLTSVCGGGAVALWYKLIADLVRWRRSRLEKGVHGD